jgi:hypothetical protein
MSNRKIQLERVSAQPCSNPNPFAARGSGRNPASDDEEGGEGLPTPRETESVATEERR